MRALRRTAALAAGMAAVLVAAAGAHAGGWVPGAADPRGGDTSVIGTPALAVSPAGTAVMVWATSAPVGIAVSIRPPGGGWSAPRALWSGGTVDASPDVAIDARGGITAVWVADDRARAAYRAPGGDWGPVQDLSPGGATGAISVAVNDGGGAAAVWVTQVGGTTQVEGAIRSNGASTFGLRAGVSGYGDFYRTPRVAIDPAGDVAAIWERRYDPGNGGGPRYVAEVTAKGVTQDWPDSSPGLVNVSSLTSGNALSVSYDVRMTADGSAVAVWDHDDGTAASSAVSTTTRAVAAAGFAAATWQIPRALTTGPTTGGVMALDGSGGLLAAWHDAPSTTLFAGYRPPLGAMSGAAVGATTSSDAFLEASPGGDAMLVWTTNTLGVSDVATSHRAPGGAFGVPVSIAHGDPGGGGASFVLAWGVGVDDQGNAYVPYSAGTGAGAAQHLLVATYDNAPPAIDAVGVPAAGTSGQGLAMSASASDRASAVSYAWSFGDGATAAGAGVAHAYARAGTYAVTVTATDQAGNASSATRTVVVSAPALGGGLPPGGGGGGGGAAKKLPVVPAKATIKVKRLSHGRTRVVSLSLAGVKAGDTVKLSCSGGGCTKTLKHGRTLKPKKVKGGKLSLTTYVKRLTLSAKAKLRVSVARKSYKTLVITYTMVKGKDPRRTLS